MWEWDSSLYSGSAAHYARGRIAYPDAVADALAIELGLDGTGRLLDVGCGPGSLTLLLANAFKEVVGLDADAGMIDEARRAGVVNARWVRMRAEDLPADLGRFQVITFAQSLHWMDRPKVLAAARGMLEAGGACAHVHATTHQGVDTDVLLPHPFPPQAEIAELVRSHLGPIRRAGLGSLPNGTAGGEAEIYRTVGFTGPRRIVVPGRAVIRELDDVVAAVFSLSSSTPQLFGERRAEFEEDLRELLRGASENGVFSAWAREVVIDLWQP
ncbi:bifunctional 2-polyprenyl-6-hydroxyphenol methylase/3-demethylubiquinol 3-O-methyltransferase UbiG [Allokutzneria sp. NRRL B-24872]|uniref:class I SAM-dependent methyltransferase n=1 Tax=Allokutzneria sp. NRRL B-24872 TaxID=1137961 RepID=UPI001FED9E06|nr:class I SAM-dependent methyltransferase [Allokutzneria sp. NRRL B-24872]